MSPKKKLLLDEDVVEVIPTPEEIYAIVREEEL